MNLPLALALVTLSLAQIVAIVAILNRYAIPRSPQIFHALVAAPTAVAAVVAILMAVIALESGDALFGLPLDTYLLAFFVCEALAWGFLDLYALYFFLKGKYEPPPR